MKINTKKLALIGVMVAVAMMLSYIEALLPPVYSAVPGIKLGLANIAVIFALYSVDPKSAALISLVRVALSALLFGSVMSFIYSFSGAVLSLALLTPAFVRPPVFRTFVRMYRVAIVSHYITKN